MSGWYVPSRGINLTNFLILQAKVLFMKEENPGIDTRPINQAILGPLCWSIKCS